MGQMRNANFRLENHKYKIIEGLVATGTYKSLTAFFTAATDELLSKYTDIPTLLSLDRKVKLNKSLIDGLSQSDRTQNRQIAEIQKEQEANKG